MKLITASRTYTLTTCQRKYYWAYVIGLKPAIESDTFHFGHLWHEATELRAKGDEFAFVMDQVGPHARDEITLAKLSGLLAGYYRHYEGQPEPTATEVEFTNKIGVYGWRSAGKIDGQGEGFIIERKTCSEDIQPGADYWLRLRGDVQILTYVDASGITRVIYDVVRKPTIRQKQTETPEQFGARLFEDTQARPDFYFQRRDVVILDRDLEIYRAQRREICWQIDTLTRRAKTCTRPEDAWSKTCSQMTCNFCEYAAFCKSNSDVDLEHPPTVFIIGKKDAELEQG